MGNTSSQISHKNTNATITSEFKSLRVQRYDEYFLKAKNALVAAESLRFGLHDARECAADISGTWRLRNYRFIETLRVMLWSLSASQNGEIRKTGIRILAEPPYIDVDKSSLVPETALLYESFFEYTRSLMRGPDLLRVIAENLVAMNERAPGLIEDAEPIALKSKMMTSQAMNGRLLPCEMEKAKALVDYVERAYIDMQEFIPRIPELLIEADIVGKEASRNDLIKPLEIFQRFHPGERKSVEEIKMERKRSAGMRKQ